MTDLTDEKLTEMEARYAPTPPPPCRVCGAALQAGYMGQGRIDYYCSSPEADGLQFKWGSDEEKAASEHRSRSHVMHTAMHFGARDVLVLIAEVRRRRGGDHAQTA